MRWSISAVGLDRQHLAMPDQRLRSDDIPRVLVVDADDRVRESLGRLLAIGGRVAVVGSASGAGAAFQLALDCRPDVVIIDPRLPEVAGGIGLIGRLRARLPNVVILAMSRPDSDEAAILASGADGCVRKTFRPTELVGAILAAGRRLDPC